MDRIKSHLIPVAIVGAIGAVAWLSVEFYLSGLPETLADWINGLAAAALQAQFAGLLVLMWFKRFEKPAIFGIWLLMASCLCGPLEFLCSLAFERKLDQPVWEFLQFVAAPVLVGAVMLITGRPKALFPVTADDDGAKSPPEPKPDSNS